MENKKKFLLLLILLLLIVGGAFFAFKSCEPRQKPDSDQTSEENPSDSTAENLSDTEKSTGPSESISPNSANFNELSAFINANIEFTCEIIKNQALTENQKESETKVNAAYAKYGLPVNDDKQMIAILKKYENDNEIISIVRENTKPCKEGAEPIFYKQD